MRVTGAKFAGSLALSRSSSNLVARRRRVGRCDAIEKGYPTRAEGGAFKAPDHPADQP